MLKNILNVEGVSKLKKNQLESVNGGMGDADGRHYSVGCRCSPDEPMTNMGYTSSYSEAQAWASNCRQNGGYAKIVGTNASIPPAGN